MSAEVMKRKKQEAGDTQTLAMETNLNGILMQQEKMSNIQSKYKTDHFCGITLQFVTVHVYDLVFLHFSCITGNDYHQFQNEFPFSLSA